jgi:hypothetical protein
MSSTTSSLALQDDSIRIASAVKAQTLIRRFLARARVRKVAEQVWERTFDPPTSRYFWFNKRTGQSQWKTPVGVKSIYKDVDELAAIHFQRITRGFISRMRVAKVAAEFYGRFYDIREDAFYWMDRRTGETTWVASDWLQRQQIPLSNEDNMLYNANFEIKRLQEQLKRKDEEIQLARQQRFDELEPLVVQSKVTEAKSLKRSKHMDEWTVSSSLVVSAYVRISWA